MTQDVTEDEINDFSNKHSDFLNKIESIVCHGCYGIDKCGCYGCTKISDITKAVVAEFSQNNQSGNDCGDEEYDDIAADDIRKEHYSHLNSECANLRMQITHGDTQM
jgi:hypothetical protein